MTEKSSSASLARDTSQDELDADDSSGWHTPTRQKRKSPDDFLNELGRTPKKVSFGPDLNPEIFSKHNPPNTPVKRGDQQPPSASTPSFLSKLAAAGGTPKSILTPSKSSRTSVLQGLEKPTPLKLKLFSPEFQKSATTPKKQGVVAEDVFSSGSGKSPYEQDEETSDCNAGSSHDSLWKKSCPPLETNAVSAPTLSESYIKDASEEVDDDDVTVRTGQRPA